MGTISRLAVALVVVWVSTTALLGATAHADSERFEFAGTLTGAAYTARWSCATGGVTVTIDGGTPNRTIETVIDTGGGTDILTFTARPVGIPNIVSAYEKKSSGEFTITERWEDSSDEPTFVGSGSWWCPAYDELPAASFVPIDPIRVLDTRPDTSINYSGTKPDAGDLIALQRSALPDLPDGAIAVSITLTGTEANAPGFLRVIPAGTTAGQTSNVNLLFAGHTVANSAIVKLSEEGIEIFNRSGSHVLVDVNGYFVEADGPVRAGRFESFDAVRVLDTRAASAVGYSGDKPVGGSTLTVDVVDASPIPVGLASAAVVNVTATESEGPGYVQASAAGALVPGASSILNFTGQAQTAASFAIVPVTDEGHIDLYTLSGAHLIVDVVGYFTNDSAPSSTSGRYVPLDPERVLDTRFSEAINATSASSSTHDISAGRYLARQSRTFPLFALTDVASAFYFNLTAVDTPDPGYLQIGPYNSMVEGATSNVNVSYPFQVVANAAVSRMPDPANPSGGSVFALSKIYMRSGGNAIADLAGYFT